MIEIHRDSVKEYYDEQGEHLFTVVDRYEEDAHYYDNGQVVYVGRDVEAHYAKMSPEQAEREFAPMYEEFEKQRDINRSKKYLEDQRKKDEELAKTIQELPKNPFWKGVKKAYKEYQTRLAEVSKTEAAIDKLKKQIEELRSTNPWQKAIDAYHKIENEMGHSKRLPEKIKVAKEKNAKREADPEWKAICIATQSLIKDGNKGTARVLIQTYLKSHEKQ